MTTTAHHPAGPAALRLTTWPAEIRALLAATFIARAIGFCYPFLPYHLDALNLDPQAIGMTLTGFGVGWLIGSVLWGWLADRIGRRDTLVTAMALAALTLALLAQAQETNSVMAAACVAGVVYDATRPVFSAAIAARYPDDESRAAVNAHRNFAVNVAAAIAGASGGLLADPIGIPGLLWANAAACAVCAFIAWTHVDPQGVRSNRTPLQTALRDRRLWLLLTVSLATLTAAAGLFSSLPLLMTQAGMSAADYGWAQGANAVAVLALSPFMNRWLSRRAGNGQPMTGLLAGSALVLGTSMASAALASTVIGFSLSAALVVPGEIIAFVAAGDILMRIAPPGAHGLYAGVWGTTLAGAVVVAPMLATLALEQGGPDLVGASHLATGALGAALCWPLARAVRAPRQRGIARASTT
ncbi:MFS transporter [Streptomyces sp. HK10]|uniref:MFS transporter n=1 Tax=Streptomyces sp. HK10 TaxID=3373255 RepID=UPI003748E471